MSVQPQFLNLILNPSQQILEHICVKPSKTAALPNSPFYTHGCPLGAGGEEPAPTPATTAACRQKMQHEPEAEYPPVKSSPYLPSAGLPWLPPCSHPHYYRRQKFTAGLPPTVALWLMPPCAQLGSQANSSLASDTSSKPQCGREPKSGLNFSRQIMGWCTCKACPLGL